MNREAFLARPILEVRLRWMKKAAWGLSAAVLVLVILMRSPYKIPLPEGFDFTFLPPVHAVLNTLTAICLVAAIIAVKRRRPEAHGRFMTAALVFSTLFLLCYVAYHFTEVETRFGGTGGARTFYLVLLFTHIIAAAVSFPFILRSFVYAWCHDFASHRRLARKVYPLWLFVAVTGPICYLMLRPWYGT